MSAHTPGPWTVEVEGRTVSFAVAHRGPWVSDREAWGNAATAEANSRLIAAAPDLLAALEQIWEICGRGPDGGDIDAETDWEAVRAAIARARGSK